MYAGIYMRICMYSIDRVFNKGTGGVRRFLELMSSLSDDGNEIHLYSADETEEIRKHGYEGRTITRTASSQRKKMIGVKSAFGNSDLFEEIRQLKFDRVVVFDVRAALSLVINRIHNINLFIRQDMYEYKQIQLEDQHASRIKKWIFLKVSIIAEALCLTGSDKIIVQCKYDLNGLLKRHPLFRNEITRKSYIQINNVNPSWIAAGKTNEERNDYQYDISFIGNFKDYRKGHDLLIPALQELSDEGMKIRAAIIGDGRHWGDCKQSCAKYPGIEFLGRLDNPIPVLKSSRLLIVPSYADSCPNTVLEGLYYRIPVIGSNRSGIPEILNNPSWLFEMNVASIKEKIRDSLEPQNNDILRKQQLTRRNELSFDWGAKMAEIVTS